MFQFKFSKATWTSIFGLFLIVVVFVLVTILTNHYQTVIADVVTKNNEASLLIYVAVTILATVIAPVSTLPLIPLATSMWGWFVAGLLSIFGWVLGAQIAFFLARKYGKKLVIKIISLQKLEKMEHQFGTDNIFWTIVLLRMTVPVDILSYALGLFSTVSARIYFFATLLGVIPFAFIFAYAGSLSLGNQLMVLVEVSLFIFVVYLFKKYLNK